MAPSQHTYMTETAQQPSRFDQLTANLDWIIILILTMCAYGFRVYQIGDVPPGLRVDELSNAFVVSQHVLDGDLRFFYPDASGHEGLYHLVQAVLMGIFGRSIFSIRAASVLFGTLTVPLTYLVGRTLFNNRRPALFSSICMIVSFWSLIYSRTGTRHISAVFFMLVTFYFFWKGCGMGSGEWETSGRKAFIWAGVFMGLSLHTYFAAWNVPLIIGAFCLYCVLFSREQLRGNWVNIATMYVIAALIAIPLIIGMVRQSNANNSADEVGRVAEVSAPLRQALTGDFSLVAQHAVGTLGMFHNEGDSEWLYNISGRPIFSLPIAAIFWFNVVLESFLNRRKSSRHRNQIVFLMIWLVAGLFPSVLSVPVASLGHTIVAQPAVYLILGLFSLQGDRITPLYWGIMALIIGSIAINDVPAYFNEWPSRGNVRFYYHAAQYNLGAHLSDDQTSPKGVGVSSLLVDYWDRVALQHAAGSTKSDSDNRVQPRMFNPARAIMLKIEGNPAVNYSDYPEPAVHFNDLYSDPVTSLYGFNRRQIDQSVIDQIPEQSMICWENGLCLLTADFRTPYLDLTWEVRDPFTVPPVPRYSFPPIPGTYTGPRLHVFTQLWGYYDEFIMGDDGLWVDPETLRPGDVFRQRHILTPPDDPTQTIAIGLYDPMTGNRVPTTVGTDLFTIPYHATFQ